MVQIISANSSNKQQQQNSSKYFLFYYQLPECLTTEIIQHLIKLHLIHHENPLILIDTKENCFEIILNSKENQQKLLSTPLSFVGETLHASLTSNKICRNIPCSRKQTCFFSHSAVLPLPLFSERVRSWASNYWQSKIPHMKFPDDVKNIIPPASAANSVPPSPSSPSPSSPSFGIQVPSEFYQQVKDFPLYYDFIPSVHSRLAFKEIKKHLPDLDSHSYYVYNWDGTFFILSHSPHQIKLIKRTVSKLLLSSRENPPLESLQNHSHSHKNTKKNKKNIPPTATAPSRLPPVQHSNKNHKKNKKTSVKESGAAEIVPQSIHFQPFQAENTVPPFPNSLQPSQASPAPPTFLPSQHIAQPQVFPPQNTTQRGDYYAFQQQNYPVNQGYYPSQFPAQPQQQGQYPLHHYPNQQHYPQPIHPPVHPVHNNVQQQQQGINYLPSSTPNAPHYPPVQIPPPPQWNNAIYAPQYYYPNTFVGNGSS